MVKIDGINLANTGYKSVTINGAWISATRDDATLHDIRHLHVGGDVSWYDSRHAEVMKKLSEFEHALSKLLAQYERQIKL